MSTTDKLNYTIEAKNSIRNACIAKGVGVPDSAPFGEYGKYILALPTGGAGGDNPKLHPPIISIYKSKEIHIDDQSTNGCFSEKVAIQLNYVAFAEAIMENGHASIPFEKGAIQSGDELYAIVSAENFHDSSPTIKILVRDDFVTYGDGSLNKVTNGYNNHIKINGIDIETSIINSNYFAGNINNENLKMQNILIIAMKLRYLIELQAIMVQNKNLPMVKYINFGNEFMLVLLYIRMYAVMLLK